MRFILAAMILPTVLAAQSPPKLVVISIDGLDARLLSERGIGLKIPNIRKLMRAGAVSTDVIGVAPSNPWPAHAALATGVPPYGNGFTPNSRPDDAAEAFASAPAIKAQTLWEAAAHAGLRAATVYWPATMGAHSAFNLPDIPESKQGNAVEFAAIASHADPPSLPARIEQMFPSFEKQVWDDSSASAAAQWLLTAEKPDVLMIRMSDLDAEQHETGALSVYARDILENDDDIVGQIVAKAPPGTDFALVSDHGFENENFVVRPRVMLKRAGISGRVDVADGLIGTSDPAVAKYFRSLLARPKHTGIAREVPMAEVAAKAPALGAWIAAFDTDTNYVAKAEDHGPAIGRGSHLGVHGLWPTRRGYRSVFILSGPGIGPASLGEIDILRIAPTLAAAAGVRLKNAVEAPLRVQSALTSARR